MTLLELAKKVNGNVENDKINLDSRGYNTKKMQTKLSIIEWTDGKFIADCKITCTTQNFKWIEKEQDKIEDSLNNEIKLLTQISFVIVDDDEDFIDEDAYSTDDKDDAKIFFSEKSANRFIDRAFLTNCKIIKNA